MADTSQDASRTSYDVVLFGATGFTGSLVADYLAEHAPEAVRWALAGRSAAKLQAVRDRLAARRPELKDLPLVIADAGDPVSLRELAGQTRVVISTVGPYLHHGEALVAACAEAGCDYVDLTGEPEFVDTMYLKYHARAVETGARLVHCCGFDSIPTDLGVLYTMRELGPQTGPVRVSGFIRVRGAFSGGTLASAMLAMSRPKAMARTSKARRAAEPKQPGRRFGVLAGPPRHDKTAHAWIAPLPVIDNQVALRSAAALPEYGPDFRYGHFAAVRRLPIALGALALVSGLAISAQVKPLRAAVGKVVKPGQGPDERRRAGSWFTLRLKAEAGGRTLVTEVSGGDPGYGETAKMLAESALCLAFDDLPPTAGQLTTATAMGDALIARLSRAGITFRTLSAPPTSAPGPAARR
ncbi:Saccharopine dehydrogenase (NAD(+), L-glutamate- forming) [Catenulispora acidiphila DSM 44928]|uniref:Saccharopine dehydrogenase (NAD(+), L-glutamate-forming) n=1 Tax=Catenulispora acidiphila (strain DSM 44928 / JCM 14897 / NBRC 102108 / NRRL B-24433 / ID139908) TaxID=479433 RepID=C7PZW0_CATAD|nr:saccharopine dehydrogenase NADP-binding domain-containing protein [Catenulispora acidiphila]ACU73625.1 Saccharopine dehydrogenase (NAD(+), L-glutamate- forming) [Catenulispora acidiphila DSM 44928]